MGWLPGLLNTCCSWAVAAPAAPQPPPAPTPPLATSASPSSPLTDSHPCVPSAGALAQHGQLQLPQACTAHTAPLSSWEGGFDGSRPLFPASIIATHGASGGNSSGSGGGVGSSSTTTTTTAVVGCCMSPDVGKAVMGGVVQLAGSLLGAYGAGQGRSKDVEGASRGGSNGGGGGSSQSVCLCECVSVSCLCVCWYLMLRCLFFVCAHASVAWLDAAADMTPPYSSLAQLFHALSPAAGGLHLHLVH